MKTTQIIYSQYKEKVIETRGKRSALMFQIDQLSHTIGDNLDSLLRKKVPNENP